MDSFKFKDITCMVDIFNFSYPSLKYLHLWRPFCHCLAESYRLIEMWIQTLRPLRQMLNKHRWHRRSESERLETWAFGHACICLICLQNLTYFFSARYHLAPSGVVFGYFQGRHREVLTKAAIGPSLWGIMARCNAKAYFFLYLFSYLVTNFLGAEHKILGKHKVFVKKIPI